MQKNVLLMLIGLIAGSILLTACSLTLNLDPLFPTATLGANVTASRTPRATATPTVTLTPVRPTAVSNAPTQIGCVPRTEWQTYTVVRGDTLGDIARRGTTTIAILTQANCLANANNIIVGQKLYVPSPIATPAPVTPSAVGYVDILPFVQGASDVAELDRGATVTFVWKEAPTDAASVQFILLSPSTGGSQVLTTDSFPADDASATWVVPDQLSGNIAAYAYRGDQSLYRNSLARAVVSRPPLAQLPEILYFRTSIINGVNTLEWQTRNVGLVNIVWNQPDGGPGGYFELLLGSGSIAVPALGPNFRPNAIFLLFAMDANGKEILDPTNPGNVLSADLLIPVTTDAIITVSPNPVPQGGTVTITWNIVNANPNDSFSISRSRATEAGFDLVKEYLPASGSLTYTLQPEYQNFVEFILHAQGSSPEADLYSSVLVPVLAADMSNNQ